METPKIENDLTEEQKKEVVKYELKQIWDNIILELDRNIDSKDQMLMHSKADGGEFERIMKKYEEQKRPLVSFENLLTALHKVEEDENKPFRQMALFYKDVEYDEKAKPEENRKGSLIFAMPYIDLLRLPPNELKFFQDIMMGKK